MDQNRDDSDQVQELDENALKRMTRKERRWLLARIRAKEPDKLRIKFRRPDKIEAAIDNVISQVGDFIKEPISRGLAIRLIGGTQTKINGIPFRSSAYGDLFRERPEPVDMKARLLARIDQVAGIIRGKSNVK